MSTRATRILVLEDDAALSEVLSDELTAAGHEAQPALTLRDGRDLLHSVEYDVALLDLQLPDGSGLELLELTQHEGLPTECIILTGHGSVDSAVQAMKLGAYDFLSKPVAMGELLALVEKAAEKARLRRENASLRARLERQGPLPDFVVVDSHMREVVSQARRAAGSELPVVLEGPPGSGRSHLSRCVLARSGDLSLPFVVVDCRGAAESLEVDLFGRDGPPEDRRQALLEVADGGVLHLDAVEELAEPVLLKLLRAAEAGEFRAVDGKLTRRSRVRLVAATTRSLESAASRGAFSREALSRLDGIALRIPPLAARRDDIVPLARHFLAGSGLDLGEGAEAALVDYAWPGQVRELRAVVQRAALLAESGSVQAGHVRAALAGPGGWSDTAARTGLTLEELQREYIDTVLRRTEGQAEPAARLLGVEPEDLSDRLGRKPNR